MTCGAKRKGPTLLRAKSTFKSLSLPLHVGNEYFISFGVHRQINVEEQCPSANSRLNDVCWLKSPLNDVHEQNYPMAGGARSHTQELRRAAADGATLRRKRTRTTLLRSTEHCIL
jgi:hypothetical protein